MIALSVNRASSTPSYMQPLSWSSSLIYCQCGRLWRYLHHINILPQNTRRLWGSPLPSEVDHHLFLVTQKQMISSNPRHKIVYSALYSSSRPSLIHPTTAESSENFCKWHDLKLYWKSVVYTVQHTAHSDKRRSDCQVVGNWGDGGRVYPRRSQQQRWDGVEYTREIKECDSHRAATSIVMGMSSLQQVNDVIVHPTWRQSANCRGSSDYFTCGFCLKWLLTSLLVHSFLLLILKQAIEGLWFAQYNDMNVNTTWKCLGRVTWSHCLITLCLCLSRNKLEAPDEHFHQTPSFWLSLLWYHNLKENRENYSDAGLQ